MSSTRSSSLCTFTFSDGRRCRTPRQPGHPLFCTFHARKFEQSQTADRLGREIAHVFSRDYLSACDLNAALARLFTATARGHVTPKTTRTLAYLAQVMVQTLRLAEHEYTESFSPDHWRRSIRSSVHSNAPRPAVAGLQTGPTPSSAPPPQKANSTPSATPPGNAILPNGVASVANLKSQLRQLLASELAPPAQTEPQPPVAPSPAPISEKPKLAELELKLDPVPPPQSSTKAATPATVSSNNNADVNDDDDTDDNFESYVLTPAMRRRQWRERV